MNTSYHVFTSWFYSLLSRVRPKGWDLVWLTFVTLMPSTVPGTKQALRTMFVGGRQQCMKSGIQSPWLIIRSLLNKRNNKQQV